MSAAMRKVLAVTGIRSEYDILYPVLREIDARPGLDLALAVCGAHLSPWHGNSLDRIEADGFRVADRIDSLLSTDRVTQRAKGAGLIIQALAQTVERERPDFLLVVGDREESIATAVVGNYMDVLTAHIGGGDPVYGNADDPLRFAVSRLAHVHFVFAEAYGDNLVRMGEEAFRVVHSGNPSLANVLAVPGMDQAELSARLGLDLSGGFVVLLKHPLSSERESAGEQMRMTLQATCDFAAGRGLKVVGIHPNTDPGACDILEAVAAFEGLPHVRFFKNLERGVFINVIRRARCLVGNSSMGILEAPFYGLPVVNVGRRQAGRLNAGNVIFTGYGGGEILAALERSCFDEAYRKSVRELVNPYGDGTAPGIIADTLEAIDPRDERWRIKRRLVP